MNATRLSISVLSLSSLLGTYAVAQDKKKADSSQRETVARPMTEKERQQEGRETPQGAGDALPQVAERGRRLHHHRRGTHRLQAPADRRRARAVHRAVLAAPRPHSGFDRERIQGRALPPHRLRQRAFRLRHSRLEDGSRPHLHHLRPAGRKGIASLGRHLRAAPGRRRRHHLHLPLRAVALSLYRRHRQRHHHRIRRSHHVGRVPHDHGSRPKRTRCSTSPAPA